MFGGHGHNILLALSANHKENKFPGLGYDLTVLICYDQGDGDRQCYIEAIMERFPKKH